jgi:hypothetical protein
VFETEVEQTTLTGSQLLVHLNAAARRPSVSDEGLPHRHLTGLASTMGKGRCRGCLLVLRMANASWARRPRLHGPWVSFRVVSVLSVLILGAACTSSNREFTGNDTIRTLGPERRDGKVSETAIVAARTLSSFLNGTVRRLDPSLVALDAGQTTVATVGKDGSMNVWRLPDSRNSWRASTTPDPSTDFLGLSRDGQLLAVITSDDTGSVQNVSVWSIRMRKAVLRIRSTRDFVRAVWFGPDHSIIVSSYSREGVSTDSRLDLYGAEGTLRASHSVHDYVPVGTAINQFSYNPATRQHLAVANSGSGQGQGYIAWKPGGEVETIDVGCNVDGAFSPDGQFFACAAGPEDTITVWDVTKNRELTHWTGQGHPSQLNAGVCTFFDGSRGLAVEDGRYDTARQVVPTIHLYEIRTHAIVGQYPIRQIPGMPDLFTSQLGGDQLLVYSAPRALNSASSVYYVFPTPSIP